jgi:hypothetical protein
MLQRNIHSIKRLNIKPDLIRSWSGNRLIAIPIFFMRNVLRRVQDEVSTHLEKLGLAPGRTSKPARGQHTIADFQPENHEITSIASSTFWQEHWDFVTNHFDMVVSLDYRGARIQIHKQNQAALLSPARRWSPVGARTESDHGKTCMRSSIKRTVLKVETTPKWIR